MRMLRFLIALIALVGLQAAAWGQTTYTWAGSSGGAWLTAGNWSPAGGPPGANANDVAVITSTTNGYSVGINMNSNAGLQSLGAIQMGGASTFNLTVGNSSTTATGILQLNGATLNSTANVLLWNNSTDGTLNVGPNVGSGNQGMGLRLGINNGVILANNGTTINITSLISDGGNNRGFIKTGAGTLTLSGANTFTGGIQLSVGRLNFTTQANISSGTIAVTGVGTTINPLGTATTLTNNFTLPALITGRVTFVVPSTSSTVLNGTITGGVASPDPTGTGGTEFFFQGGAGGQNTGALTLNGDNTGWLGTLNIQRGPLLLGNANAAGSTVLRFDSNLPAAGVIQFTNSFTLANRIHLNSGTVNPIGVGGALTGTLSNVISSNGMLAISKVGTGTLILTGANTYSGGTTVSAGTLQIGDGGTAGSFSTGTVTNNATLAFNRSDSVPIDNVLAGPGNFNQIGTGTTTLTAANTFTGPLNVSNGTLALGASSTLATNVINANGGIFDVSAIPGYTLIAGKTLTAGRTIAATDVLGSPSIEGTISLGGTSVFRTATFGNNLTLNAGTVNFDLANTTTIGGGINDLLAVTGNLTLSGANNIAVTAANGLTNGTYTLFTYGGTLTGDATNLNLSGIAAGTTRQAFNFNTATTGSVLLSVAGSPENLSWTGANGNAWNLVTTVNNFSGPSDDRFYNFDNVSFTAGTSAVTLTGNLAPGSVAVNSTQSYTFGGTGAIIGTGALTKAGSGTLILTTNNTYSGGTTINGGTIQLGNGGTTGSIAGNVVNNGNLSFNRSDAVNLSGIISGGGSVLQTGSGTLTLSGTNTYAGTTLVTGGGSLSIATDANLGTAPAAATAGQLMFDNGTLTTTADFTLNANRGIAVANGATFNPTAGTLTYNGILAGSGGITKTGAGGLTLGGLNTFTGNTTVNAGTINFTNGSAFGTGTITFAAGVTNVAGAAGSPPTAFFNNTIATDTTVANAIVLPSPGTATTYTIQKTGVDGQINFTGNISGGNADTKLFLNTSSGGDNTTTYRFAGNNTFLATIEVWRGGVIVASNTALGDSSNLIRFNSNNNTTLGDLRFEASVTLANPIELVTGGGGPINTNANNVTLSGVISGGYAGGLNKLGTGTLSVTNANSYTAGTFINAGILAVNNTTGSGTGSGVVTVNAAGTVRGTGTVGGNLVLVGGGRVAPGNSAGTLSVTGTFAGTGIYDFELATAGTAGGNNGGSTPTLPQTNHDLLLITGAADVSGLTVNPIALTGSGFNNANPYSWTVLTATGGVTGTPILGTPTDFGSLAGGTFTLAVDANSIYLNFTPVPEPATILGLSTLGLLTLAGVRRRRAGK